MNALRVRLLAKIGLLGFAFAECTPGCCCDYACQKDAWEREVAERCRWITNKKISEVEARFQVHFNTLTETCQGEYYPGATVVVVSSDRLTEVESTNCCAANMSSVYDMCYDIEGCSDEIVYCYDLKHVSNEVLCLDGSEPDGHSDASVEDRECPTSSDYGHLVWACENCELGVQTCCSYVVWFLDPPATLQERNFYCDNLERHLDRYGCRIGVNMTHGVVRNYFALAYKGDPRCRDIYGE